MIQNENKIFHPFKQNFLYVTTLLIKKKKRKCRLGLIFFQLSDSFLKANPIKLFLKNAFFLKFDINNSKNQYNLLLLYLKTKLSMDN